MAVVRCYYFRRKNSPSSPSSNSPHDVYDGGGCGIATDGVEDVIDALSKHLRAADENGGGGSNGSATRGGGGGNGSATRGGGGGNGSASRGGGDGSSSRIRASSVQEICCADVLKGEKDLESLDEFFGRNWQKLNLRCLRLPGNNLTPTSSHALSHIIHNMNESLVELDLSDNKLLGDGFAALVKDALTTCRIEKLNLNSNKIGPKGAPALSLLLRHSKSIRELSIANNSLGLKTVRKIIVDLCENETLQILDISSNKIGDRGTNILAAALDPTVSKCPIAELDLRFNKIGPSGVYNLTKALLEGNKTLRKLDISMNAIGEGAESFGIVLQFSHTLEELGTVFFVELLSLLIFAMFTHLCGLLFSTFA